MMQAIAAKGNSPPTRRQKAVIPSENASPAGTEGSVEVTFKLAPRDS